MGVEEINQRLRAAGIPVSVRERGNSLSLRASLPIKPGDHGKGPRKQYEIRMGIPASKDGYKRIEAEAQKLGSLIILDKFNWSLYEKPTGDTIGSVADLTKRFKAHYCSTHSIKPETWDRHWQPYLDKLPPKSQLTEPELLRVILETEPHSWGRRQCCQKLQRLAEFAGLAVDLKQYQGDYGPSKVKARSVPSDTLIVEAREQVPNDRWKWAYGMLATFGLRPHEILFCDFVDPLTVQVTEGKTGPRITRAMQPEWAEAWGLIEKNPPKINWREYKDIGMRCARQFERYRLPFNAYDLRHAWCIRGSVVYRMPIPVMASLAGHSPEIHLNIYNRWISQEQGAAVYQQIVLGID